MCSTEVLYTFVESLVCVVCVVDVIAPYLRGIGGLQKVYTTAPKTPDETAADLQSYSDYAQAATHTMLHRAPCTATKITEEPRNRLRRAARATG